MGEPCEKCLRGRRTVDCKFDGVLIRDIAKANKIKVRASLPTLASSKTKKDGEDVSALDPDGDVRMTNASGGRMTPKDNTAPAPAPAKAKAKANKPSKESDKQQLANRLYTVEKSNETLLSTVEALRTQIQTLLEENTALRVQQASITRMLAMLLSMAFLPTDPRTSAFRSESEQYLTSAAATSHPLSEEDQEKANELQSMMERHFSPNEE